MKDERIEYCIKELAFSGIEIDELTINNVLEAYRSERSSGIPTPEEVYDEYFAAAEEDFLEFISYNADLDDEEEDEYGHTKESDEDEDEDAYATFLIKIGADPEEGITPEVIKGFGFDVLEEEDIIRVLDVLECTYQADGRIFNYAQLNIFGRSIFD